MVVPERLVIVEQPADRLRIENPLTPQARGREKIVRQRPQACAQP